ncbi:MAG: thioredoxin-dependent thiol peroxidase [Chthonomonadales bacterium]
MDSAPPTEGSLAPDFTLVAHNGKPVVLSSYRGNRIVVLYFYPKAETPGCTVEAKDFRDLYGQFQSAGAEVLGVSPDDVKKQARFAQKHEIPFLLLCDVDHAVADAYGVWKQKSFMGRTYMGVERTTFVIDRDGIVRRVFAKVSVSGHAAKVLEAVRALG